MRMNLAFLSGILALGVVSCKTSETQNLHELSAEEAVREPLATENLGLDLKAFITKSSKSVSEKVIKFFYDRPSEIQNLGLSFYPDRILTTDDGVDLQISYYLPQNHKEGTKFPAVIFVNPWGSSSNANQLSRLPQRLTREGYIVLLLTARGFGKSGGEAAFAAERDRKDVSLAIDWLENNTFVDRANIGIVGISYGGGVGLMSSLSEPRLKTAVGINAWTDFVEGGFLAGNGVNERAGRFLVDFGELMKSRIREAYEIRAKMLDPAAREEIAAWGRLRSPRQYLDQYNERKIPLYFVHTYNDAFFKPNAILEFYQKYQGPKKVSFYHGVHGTNMMFEGYAKQGAGDDVIQWFNYWLRDQKQQEIGINAVDFSIRNRPLNRSALSPARERVRYPEWSPQSFAKQNLYLSQLLGNPVLREQAELAESSTQLKTASAPSLFGGDQDRDLLLEGLFGWPVKQNLSKLDPRYTAVYTGPIMAAKKIRGISQLHLKIRSLSANPQLTAYLFAKSKDGEAFLITQGSSTAINNARSEAEFKIDFHAIAYDLEEGDQLVLVVDTKDWDFYAPKDQNNDVTLLEGPDASRLELSYED